MRTIQTEEGVLPWLQHQSVPPKPEKAGGRVQLNTKIKKTERRKTKLDLVMLCSFRKAPQAKGWQKS